MEGTPDKSQPALPRDNTPAALLPVEGRMPSLDNYTGWLNSPPLTVAGLRGSVVLVDFPV